ncbi:MAG: TerC family protein [Fimbriimonadales bacterium]|nr:TerC family protein [Fimbriimonadales bacterium]
MITAEFWLAFVLIVGSLMAIDLFVVHRTPHEVKPRAALLWAALWVALAVLFNIGIAIWYSRQGAVEFFSAYLIELSLSVDNLFVFLVIFRYFRIAPDIQHRLLFVGVLSALIMRALFIMLGLALLQHFHWMTYVFGLILILTALRLLRKPSEEVEIERNLVMRVARRFLRLTPVYHGGRFFIRQNGQLVATPLLVALILIESTDLMFALDSIPAALAVSRDPFIVYTSNAFAILGLRSFFFVLAGFMNRFVYLHYGLAVILFFVGVKMLLAPVYKISPGASLGFIASILLMSVVLSLLVGSKETPDEENGDR